MTDKSSFIINGNERIIVVKFKVYLILFEFYERFFYFILFFWVRIFLLVFCQLVRSPGIYVENSSDKTILVCTIIPDYGNWLLFKLTMWLVLIF